MGVKPAGLAIHAHRGVLPVGGDDEAPVGLACVPSATGTLMVPSAGTSTTTCAGAWPGART